MSITSLINILEETFVSFPKQLFKKLEQWMNDNIQIVAQLSKNEAWKPYRQPMEQMYIERVDEKNILSYVHFARLCDVIK